MRWFRVALLGAVVLLICAALVMGRWELVVVVMTVIVLSLIDVMTGPD